jgi:membrane fusion protein (multidrug efflux system)
MLNVAQFFCRINRVTSLVCLVTACLFDRVSCGVEPPLKGIILPFQDVDLTFPVLGIIAEVKVSEGDVVRAGQALVRLDDRLEKLEVKKAEAVLEQARFENEATAKLIAEDIGTRTEALAKRITLDLALNSLETSKAKEAQRTILSSIDGVVVRINKEVGESVLLNEVVMRVAKLNRVYAQFYISADEAALLRPGNDFRMKLTGSAQAGKFFSGKVALVDPVLDAESALVRVRVEVANDKGELKAGMRVEKAAPAQTP